MQPLPYFISNVDEFQGAPFFLRFMHRFFFCGEKAFHYLSNNSFTIIDNDNANLLGSICKPTSCALLSTTNCRHCMPSFILPTTNLMDFSVVFVEQMHYLSNLVHISGSITLPSFYKGDDLGTVCLNLKRGLRPMQS